MEVGRDKYIEKEKRKHVRVYTTFAEYHSVEGITSEETPSFVENISANGICILVSENIKTDTILFLKIFLPDGGHPIAVEGKVLWTNVSSFLVTEERKHYDVGIEFIKIDEEDRERIREYSSKCTKEEKNL